MGSRRCLYSRLVVFLPIVLRITENALQHGIHSLGFDGDLQRIFLRQGDLNTIQQQITIIQYYNRHIPIRVHDLCRYIILDVVSRVSADVHSPPLPCSLFDKQPNSSEPKHWESLCFSILMMVPNMLVRCSLNSWVLRYSIFSVMSLVSCSNPQDQSELLTASVQQSAFWSFARLGLQNSKKTSFSAILVERLDVILDKKIS